MTTDERKRRLIRALRHAGPMYRLEDVVSLVNQGRCQWWEGSEGNAMVVTEINEHPMGNALHYWLIAGELEGCLALEARIEQWGKEQGCIVATATGRRGWKPIVEARGWRLHGYSFFKPLSEG